MGISWAQGLVGAGAAYLLVMPLLLAYAAVRDAEKEAAGQTPERSIARLAFWFTRRD